MLFLLNVNEHLDKFRRGYFPFWNHHEAVFGWYRQDLRTIIPLTEAVADKAARGLKKYGTRFVIEENTHIDEVLSDLQDENVRKNTWVSDEVCSVYQDLHLAQKLITVETLREDRLAGALLGIELGKAFLAETMYLRPGERNASKVCLYHTVCKYYRLGYFFIDVQMPHPADHPSARLGEETISFTDYERLLWLATSGGLNIRDA